MLNDDLNFNYKFIGNFDVSEILKEIKNIPDEHWVQREEAGRNGIYGDGKFVFDTIKSYPISELGFGDLNLLVELSTLMKRPLEPVNVCKSKKIYELIDPIAKHLESLNDNYCRGSIVFSCLIAGQNIPVHTDYVYRKNESVTKFLDKMHRYHLVITTHDDVIFEDGGEKINMKVGECWEINKKNVHAVYNPTNVDRIHLVIDTFSKDLL